MGVGSHIARIRELDVHINDWTEAYRVIANAFKIGEKHSAFELLAFAETVAQAMYADIELGKESGGTYYLDGRKVRNGIDAVYCVGGAYPTGIILDKREMNNFIDVLAAIQLLREVIVQLQSDSDEPVGLGFWIDSDNPDECWIDASNLVTDREEAIALARKRGEKAIWDTYAQDEIMITAKRLSKEEMREGAKRFYEWKRKTVRKD